MVGAHPVGLGGGAYRPAGERRARPSRLDHRAAGPVGAVRLLAGGIADERVPAAGPAARHQLPRRATRGEARGSGFRLKARAPGASACDFPCRAALPRCRSRCCPRRGQPWGRRGVRRRSSCHPNKHDSGRWSRAECRAPRRQWKMLRANKRKTRHEQRRDPWTIHLARIADDRYRRFCRVLSESAAVADPAFEHARLHHLDGGTDADRRPDGAACGSRRAHRRTGYCT